MLPDSLNAFLRLTRLVLPSSAFSISTNALKLLFIRVVATQCTSLKEIELQPSSYDGDVEKFLIHRGLQGVVVCLSM